MFYYSFINNNYEKLKNEDLNKKSFNNVYIKKNKS